MRVGSIVGLSLATCTALACCGGSTTNDLSSSDVCSGTTWAGKYVLSMGCGAIQAYYPLSEGCAKCPGAPSILVSIINPVRVDTSGRWAATATITGAPVVPDFEQVGNPLIPSLCTVSRTCCAESKDCGVGVESEIGIGCGEPQGQGPDQGTELEQFTLDVDSQGNVLEDRPSSRPLPNSFAVYGAAPARYATQIQSAYCYWPAITGTRAR